MALRHGAAGQGACPRPGRTAAGRQQNCWRTVRHDTCCRTRRARGVVVRPGRHPGLWLVAGQQEAGLIEKALVPAPGGIRMGRKDKAKQRDNGKDAGQPGQYPGMRGIGRFRQAG